MPHDFFDVNDLYKAFVSIGAGFILGLERELKDKKAGLKTISVICLGATLFAIISQRIGGENNAGQIAAYIVSGVGFIGAGAIFKEGFSISGLTTAGIVWLAAAIGTSIGFGEYYTAAIFLAASYVAVIGVPFLVNYFTPNNVSYKLEIVFTPGNDRREEALLQLLRERALHFEIKAYKKTPESCTLSCEIFMRAVQSEYLKQELETREHISAYSFLSS